MCLSEDRGRRAWGRRGLSRRIEFSRQPVAGSWIRVYVLALATQQGDAVKTTNQVCLRNSHGTSGRGRSRRTQSRARGDFSEVSIPVILVFVIDAEVLKLVLELRFIVGSWVSPLASSYPSQLILGEVEVAEFTHDASDRIKRRVSLKSVEKLPKLASRSHDIVVVVDCSRHWLAECKCSRIELTTIRSSDSIRPSIRPSSLSHGACILTARMQNILGL